MTAPALENLDITRAEWHGGPGTPRYALADHQREAIVVALSDATRLAVARGPSDAAVQALAAYNCYGCHLRGDAAGTVGGPDAVRGAYFAVAPGLDLGDEGRLPPTLTGVGGRLKPTALASVLTESRLHVRRDTMITRMPRFGGELLSGLAAALAAADARPGDLEEPPFTAEAIAAGRALVGDQGLRCMTCHDVGVYPAQGVSTIDMASFYERLRPGWFRRFLPDPAAFNDATRMPTFWPDGRVVHPDLADGTVAGQVDAIYSYVSLGPSMPAPSGMDIGDAMVLAPTDEPIVFRTFMAEAGPRAIVVGYPESVHVAFDANVIRLAKAWRGGFFDARGTWSGRAGRFLDPYGDDVLEMPPGPALAFLDSLEEPWPTAARTDRDVGGRWLGYRLDSQRRPVFRYRLGGVEIEEQPVPALSPGGADLTRRFNLEAGQVAASGSLYLLLGEGEEISRGDDGSWSIDGRVRVELAAGTPASPIVRTSQGVQQLLVPIGITAGGTTAIDVLISW